MTSFNALCADAAFAVRLWRRSPGWTAAALASLALGIGATALVFSLVDAVLLAPFPYQDAGRLVFLWGSKSRTQTPGVRLDLRDVRRSGGAFADADVFLGNMRVALGREESDSVPAACIGARVPGILGVQPALGTTSGGRQTVDGPVVILSHALWRARFGEDPSIVGRGIHVNGIVHTVSAVMPAGFFFPDVDARIWMVSPCLDGLDERQMHAIARLAPGVSLEQAQAELDAVNQRLTSADPTIRRATGVFRIHDIVVGDYQRALWTLLAAVTLVLLTACVNVANLQLSRAVDRHSEMAIRAAAGATRARLMRQALTESAMLAGVATALGCLVSWAGLRLVQALGLTDIPRLDTARIDERALLIAAVAGVVAVLISGTWPARKVAQIDVGDALKHGGTASAARPHSGARDLLAVTEVALAMILVVTTALVTRSFVQISRADWGFDPERLLLLDVAVPPAMERDPTAVREWSDAVVERLRRLPDVEAASHSVGVPIRWKSWSPIPVSVDGRYSKTTAGVWTIGDGYFSTAGVRIVEGRDFSRADDASASKRIIVSRAFADQAWPGREPIGRQLQLLEVRPEARERVQREAAARAGAFDSSVLRVIDGASWDVIGVVENVRMFGLEIGSNPAVYIVESQLPRSMMRPKREAQFLVRAARRDPSLSNSAKAAILAIDPDVRFSELAWMEDLVAQSIGGRSSNRLLVVVSATFGFLALTFAAIGIYGMLSANVSHRLRELAIRTALGATRRTIVYTVASRMARLIVGGLALGATIAWAVTRGIAPLLFQVSPSDPGSYGLAVAVLAAAACAAGIAPLHRALRSDPTALLKT